MHPTRNGKPVLNTAVATATVVTKILASGRNREAGATPRTANVHLCTDRVVPIR